MNAFIHLHVHSAYSLSEGAISMSRLKALCLDAGTPAVAITDTNNLFGALEVSETLAKAGIQPIIGLQQAFRLDSLAEAEPKDAKPASLVLLAQSATGYANLMKLSSSGFLHSAREDCVCADISWLEGAADGLICLTGGFDGPVDRLLRAGRPDDAAALVGRLAALFPGRLYAELQRHEG
ncbi:MAG: PHP domain-containing protein, partial [Parvularculaceae bacterium]